MSESNKDQLKENFKLWGLLANFIVIAAVFWNQAQWQARVDKDMEQFKRHIQDDELHMDYKVKSELFIPRKEYDIQNDNIMRILLDIQADVKASEKRDRK